LSGNKKRHSAQQPEFVTKKEIPESVYLLLDELMDQSQDWAILTGNRWFRYYSLR
jgi:hypothetical protein